MSVVEHPEAIGESGLFPPTKLLLQKTCMKRGTRRQFSDDEGHVLLYSYHWRGASVSADAQQRVFGDVVFKNEDAKQKLARYAETEHQKRQMTCTQKTRTVVRKKERRQKKTNCEGSASEEN